MPRIDDSHHSFKRSTTIGPGPKNKVKSRSGDYECEKGKNTSTHYVQVCTYVGDNRARRGKKIKVKTNIAKKKKYNKLHRKWAENNRTFQARAARGPRPSYRCRKTKIAKCAK